MCISDNEFEEMPIHSLHWWAGIDGDLGSCLSKLRQAECSCTASNSPLDTALELSSLVKLGSQIEEVDLR